MRALTELIAAASDDQLRATRRLLHRAYLGRDRLGWPTLNPFAAWRGLFSERNKVRLEEHERDHAALGDPILILAACLEVSAELERRGTALPCLPCRAELAPFLDRPLESRPSGPVASVAASGSGG